MQHSGWQTDSTSHLNSWWLSPSWWLWPFISFLLCSVTDFNLESLLLSSPALIPVVFPTMPLMRRLPSLFLLTMWYVCHTVPSQSPKSYCAPYLCWVDVHIKETTLYWLEVQRLVSDKTNHVILALLEPCAFLTKFAPLTPHHVMSEMILSGGHVFKGLLIFRTNTDAI